jgi:hypothetical protein
MTFTMPRFDRGEARCFGVETWDSPHRNHASDLGHEMRVHGVVGAGATEVVNFASSTGALNLMLV